MKKPKQFKPSRANSKKFEKKGSKRSSTEMGYDRHWTKYRFRFLHYNPNCYVCGNKAVHVDHITRARDNPDKFKDLKNHCPMCARCHSTITGKFDRGEVQDLEGKITFIKEYRERFKVTVKIKVLDRYSKDWRV